MTQSAVAALSERRMVAHGLRLSARLADATETAFTGAAVELAIRALDGEFTDAGWPWVTEGGPDLPFGLFRLDSEAMTAWNHGRPAHAVMAFVEALAGGRPARRLPQLLSLLDGPTQQLILTGFHFAALDRLDVAMYAFGGDPRQLVTGGLQLPFWPACDVDITDQPKVQVRGRLSAAGGAR